MPNRVSARNLIAFQIDHLSSHVDIDNLIMPTHAYEDNYLAYCFLDILNC